MSRPHARLRLACALTLAGIATLLGVAPAAATPAIAAPATPAAGTLVPLVDCVQDASLGAVTARTVVLGYRSTASAPVAIPAGSGGNDLTSGAADRGQPTSFAPGEHHGVWLLTVDAAAEPDLAWHLGDGVAAFTGAPACTAATSVTLSVPERVSPGGTVSVSATVARMLLAAPDTGTVAVSLDGAAPLTVPISSGGVARAELPVGAAGAHTVTATYQPAQGSSLLASSATAAFTATAAAVSSPLAVATDSVVTGGSSVLVTVSRAAAQGAATVDVMTADGSARAGTDYSPVATTLTLADGQASATVRVPLGVRPAGSPAATFFVLLQRASVPVATASATVVLPAVPVATPASASATSPRVGGAGGASASSALPAGDPTATTTGTLTNVGQDLAFLLGGVLLTGGGIAGVLGLVRAAAMRGARP